ncbi:hypothetical protein [Falsiruegeria mediterranea]|uniref:Core-binding (CB) domain-containing protein n=1 Tax=Falsiruegeria mediterranea M17 TaxID=1200281 RepID=A0A2R8CB52_9RHOB|nr:hypothetical protein [Falsiruegeria mediterranea]SPJ29588.1 hypothetical protein TRM7615_03108 [Falsiruegeria mediterranea M17]
MTQIIERKRADGSTAYLAQIAVKRKGQWLHRESRTFDRKSTAEAWHIKRMKEIKALGDDLSTLRRKNRTLSTAIDKYLADTNERIGKTKKQVLETIRDEYDISEMNANDIQSADIVDFLRLVSARDGVGSPATVLNYASHLAAVFRIAKPAWGIPLNRLAMTEAMEATKRLGITRKSKSRNRRPTLDELDALLTLFEDKHVRRPSSLPMHRVVGFALFSTRRQEEITRVAWDG